MKNAIIMSALTFTAFLMAVSFAYLLMRLVEMAGLCA